MIGIAILILLVVLLLLLLKPRRSAPGMGRPGASGGRDPEFTTPSGPSGVSEAAADSFTPGGGDFGGAGASGEWDSEPSPAEGSSADSESDGSSSDSDSD